jgi:serine/threonine protein kinase
MITSFPQIVILLAIDLLKKMLLKNPLKRISSFEALEHPCFNTVLSQSPLLRKKSDFIFEQFLQQDIIVKKENEKFQENIPNNFEEFSVSSIEEKLNQ